jgi:protein-tyrosine phosphatase
VTSPNFVEIDGLANFRDIGGYPVSSGVVRSGRVYRSDSLHRLTPDGMAAVHALNVATIIDLRSQGEAELRPGPLPAERVPMLDNVVLDSVVEVTELRGTKEGEERLRDVYFHLVDSSATSFGRALTLVATAEPNAVIVHCAGGKDRTGISIALLLSVLGADRELVLDDYEAQPIHPAHAGNQQEVHDAMVGHGIDSETARGLLGRPRWVMASVLDHVGDVHGGVESYLTGAAQMDLGTLDQLRESLVRTGDLPES